MANCFLMLQTLLTRYFFCIIGHFVSTLHICKGLRFGRSPFFIHLHDIYTHPASIDASLLLFFRWMRYIEHYRYCAMHDYFTLSVWKHDCMLLVISNCKPWSLQAYANAVTRMQCRPADRMLRWPLRFAAAAGNRFSTVCFLTWNDLLGGIPYAAFQSRSVA